MPSVFSVEQDEVLVEQVAHHPPLWHLSHPNYRIQRFGDNMLAEIADTVGKSSEFDHWSKHDIRLIQTLNYEKSHKKLILFLCS